MSEVSSWALSETVYRNSHNFTNLHTMPSHANCKFRRPHQLRTQVEDKIMVGKDVKQVKIYIYIYILSIIYQLANHKRGFAPRDYPLYPIFHLPKAVLDSERATVQYRIYWTVSKRGYGHSAHAVPTQQSSVNVLNENIINISSFAENIETFSLRFIFIVNNIFNIGWLTVQYR